MKSKLIYLAGPISQPNPMHNLHEAVQVASHLIAAGYTPYLPQLSVMHDAIRPEAYEDWMSYDFRVIANCGLNVRMGERAGLVYEYDWAVRKNPQAQAIRTKSRELQFVGLETDRAKQRGCLSDYLIKFRAPGENAVPINAKGQVSRNEWIDWAEGTWSDINENDTLNTSEAKSEDDVKHICPLQLEVYRRSILLYSNPGEIVFEPFGGIGSGGFVARGGQSIKTKKRIADKRRYYCCEIKPEYYTTAERNIQRADEQTQRERSLPFAMEAK